MSTFKTYLSIGDFIDVYHKARQIGLPKLLAKFKISSTSRITSKWDSYVSMSDFWLIPEIQKRWNYMISGNENTIYEDYVCAKYLSNKSNLKLLSVGCGEGFHDRNFAKNKCFSQIDAIDVSEGSIQKAKAKAIEEQLNINYFTGYFKAKNFEKESYDVIFFDSSLHHFSNVKATLQLEVKPLLKSGGILIVFEYCGPNRLQYTTEQLEKATEILKSLPKKYKLLYDNKSYKKKVYRPGLIRMFLVDPSEAPDSLSIPNSLRTTFKVLEEQQLGWNILHILLKGISHNFINDEIETKQLLAKLFFEEDEFLFTQNHSDAIFGVYQK